MSIKQKIGAALAIGSLAASVLAPAAFADASLEISGNGTGSDNKIVVKNTSNCTVKQKSNTNVGLEVNVYSNTGGNKASGNTGGDVTIDTGSVTTDISVDVAGGSNEATNPCCCVPEGQDASNSALISGNGEDTTNRIRVKNRKTQYVKQKANTDLVAGLGVTSKTGKNKAKNNTGGGTGVTTGNVDTTVGVTVEGGANTINP